MQVVDPHVHLWNTEKVRYPWLANPKGVYSGNNRFLAQKYDVDDLLRDAGPIEILKTVDIEANPADTVAEARWLQRLADRSGEGNPHRIIAYAELSRPDAPELLEHLSSCRNLRGVRQILNVHHDSRFDYVGRDYMQGICGGTCAASRSTTGPYDLQTYSH